MSGPQLIKAAEQLFAANAKAENAAPMKAYMKDVVEFYGIKTPERRALTKQLIQQHRLPEYQELMPMLKAAYQSPYRELHHFANEVLQRFAKKAGANYQQLVEYAMLHHSWWDTLDHISAECVGVWLLANPQYADVTEQWISSENMWLRRCAIIYQRKYKAQTDEAKLFDYCRRCAHESEFFIQKGIGWALREYGKTAPKAVKQFIENTELSALSRREGSRRL